jgi:hypothetical protein
MIASFEDFCLWMYVLIDDFWQQAGAAYRRPGPAPRCSDPELLTMVLVGECCGWDVETELLSHWRQHPDLFPVVPERSRFNRRRRNLLSACNDLRRVVLATFDLATDRQCAIDSLPVPVMHFHLVPRSPAKADWQAAGAAFGYVASKKHRFLGYTLHLLVTLNGVIRDFALAPANLTDLVVGEEVLAAHRDLDTLGDKAYISRAVAARLREEAQVRLWTIPRRNQRDQTGAALADVHRRLRAIIETVNDQLVAQFHIQDNHAHSFGGLCARLYSKLTAHTLCQWLNWHLGVVDWRCIKTLAFPN